MSTRNSHKPAPIPTRRSPLPRIAAALALLVLALVCVAPFAAHLAAP